MISDILLLINSYFYGLLLVFLMGGVFGWQLLSYVFMVHPLKYLINAILFSSFLIESRGEPEDA